MLLIVTRVEYASAGRYARQMLWVDGSVAARVSDVPWVEVPLSGYAELRVTERVDGGSRYEEARLECKLDSRRGNRRAPTEGFEADVCGLARSREARIYRLTLADGRMMVLASGSERPWPVTTRGLTAAQPSGRSGMSLSVSLTAERALWLGQP